MRRPKGRTRPPLFLPRPDYRRRRLVDAARLLPILGGFLVLLPVLWMPQDRGGRDVAGDGIYLFVIWAFLVGLAAWLAPSLADAADGADGLDSNDAPSDATEGDA